MAKKVTLTEREITILLQVIREYIEVFSEAEDTQEYTEYMLDTGLGSALKKLYKGRNGYKVYWNYVCFREGRTYPTFEQWKCDKDKAVSLLKSEGVRNNGNKKLF